MTDTQVGADHHMRVNLVSPTSKKVLIVVANPSTATTLGWPVGFWGAELTHPYHELTERGIAVTIASPHGGAVELDSLSDPRDRSKWVELGGTDSCHVMEAPRRPRAVYGEEYRAADAQVVVDAVASGIEIHLRPSIEAKPALGR